MATDRRTALVTGANRGLGRAVAARLDALGHRVVVAARDERAARAVVAGLGRLARAVALDVTTEASVRTAHDRVGDVDILVNNAGLLLDMGHRPTSVPMAVVERELAVNTLGAWRMCHEFVPGMVTRGWGRVVMVSSGTGAFSNGIFPWTPGYSVSKAALNALTVILAKETEGTGVLVNAVNPGLVRTAMRPDADRSPEDAAVDVAWAATLDDDGPTGALLRRNVAVAW
jgi:NAD(P)-dependent dehydrogenase (short-subunit alcohol dehydrogenase family)